MSQQMHFEEEQHGYQGSYTPTLEENSGNYNQHFAEMPAQKLGATYSGSEKGASAGQRLALAIVSMVVLFAGMGFLSSGDETSIGMIAARLVGLIVVCITAIIINIVFNWRR
jgi:F0F1-type ATP synthase assembly protein I